MQPLRQGLHGPAARGDIVYNDDTTVKILELMGKHAGENGLDGEVLVS